MSLVGSPPLAMISVCTPAAISPIRLPRQRAFAFIAETGHSCPKCCPWSYIRWKECRRSLLRAKIALPAYHERVSYEDYHGSAESSARDNHRCAGLLAWRLFQRSSNGVASGTDGYTGFDECSDSC